MLHQLDYCSGEGSSRSLQPRSRAASSGSSTLPSGNDWPENESPYGRVEDRCRDHAARFSRAGSRLDPPLSGSHSLSEANLQEHNETYSMVYIRLVSGNCSILMLSTDGRRVLPKRSHLPGIGSKLLNGTSFTKRDSQTRQRRHM